MSASTISKSHSGKPAAPKSAPSRLPLIIAAALIVVALIGIGLALAGNPAGSNYVPQVTGAPHADVSRTVIDHGDVQMDEYVESVFRIRNVGDEPLQIFDEPRVELVEGCCPPRAMVSDYEIAPGEETVIRLRFTMHDMMGGPHEFRVHVLTNDPTQSLIPLTILSNWVE